MSYIGNHRARYILLQDQKADGTNGGTFTLGAWRTRDLNTIVTDETGDVTLSSNQFVLPAGAYEITVAAPALFVRVHKMRLQNITDAETTALGTTEFSGDGGATAVTVSSIVLEKFTLAASKTFEIQHFCEATVASNGFGQASGGGADATVEIYTVVKLKKVG